MKRLLLMVLLSIPAIGFGQSRDEMAVKKLLSDQQACWNRGDIDGFMKGYWKSDGLIFVSGDSVARGWQSTIDRYKKNYNTREKMGALKFSDVEIDVISKNAAVVLGSWSLATSPQPPAPVAASAPTPSSGTVQTPPAPGSPWTLVTTGMTPCGYTITITAVDRAIVNSASVGHYSSFAQGFCVT